MKQHPSKFNINRFVATACGVGNTKHASGTWGSLVGVLLAAILMQFPGAIWMGVLVTFLLGLWAIPPLIEHQTDKDPGYVVIDEIMGQTLVFACLPMVTLNPITYFLGFAFFRLFDIFKPWPVSYFDQKVHSAFGIMMDDFVAGLFAALSLLLIQIIVF